MKELKNRKSNLLIFGQESTSKEIRECIFNYYPERYNEVIMVIGDDDSPCFHSIHDKDLENYIIEHPLITYIIGFSNLKLRHKIQSKFREVGINATNIIHPSAVIAPSVKIGLGNYIGANSVLSTEVTIGNDNIINLLVSVGHDTHIGSNCIINPASNISGNCKIGDNTIIGSNSFIFQGTRIGNNCTIDALTYVRRDIDDNRLCSSRGELNIYKNFR